jgi:hypothetical protein
MVGALGLERRVPEHYRRIPGPEAELPVPVVAALG